MTKRVLESFALWSGFFILFCAGAAYLIPLAPRILKPDLLMVLYVSLAASTSVLAIGHTLLIRRSSDGKASLWLTSFTHSKIAQSVAYWGVAFLMLVRTLGLDYAWVEGVGYAMVGVAAGANVMGASMFIAAWLTHRLESRIWPTPWRVWRDWRQRRTRR